MKADIARALTIALAVSMIAFLIPVLVTCCDRDTVTMPEDFVAPTSPPTNAVCSPDLPPFWRGGPKIIIGDDPWRVTGNCSNRWHYRLREPGEWWHYPDGRVPQTRRGVMLYTAP